MVIGASENPERYSFKAIKSLQEHGNEVLAIGLKPGRVGDTEILTDKPELSDIDTVTLYISPQNQSGYQAYMLSLNPKRIIFNPGTENREFEEKAGLAGIEVLEACTLVMLSIGNY